MTKSHKQAIAALFAVAPKIVTADDDVVLPDMTITEAPSYKGVTIPNWQPTPKTSVTKAGIDLLGGAGQTSAYTPLNLAPSFNYESPDPYGMSPTRNISIRGKGDFHVTRNIEGLPITGIVGGTDLVDLENVAQVDLYRGAMPANLGLGVSNATGAVDQQLLAPQNKISALGKQALGSFGFRRTFARLDSGKLPETGTGAFISGSTSASDKWRGLGDQSRENAMFGLSQPLGSFAKVDIDLIYNKFSGASYRPLTYSQVQNLHGNYYYDYNTTLSGEASEDVNYYGFNRVEHESFAALGKIDFKLSEGQNLVLKPYYWKNNGEQYAANGKNVQIWRQENDNIGGVLEYQGRFGPYTNLVAGYWVQSMAPPPPPTDRTLYTVSANGALDFSRWSTLARIDPFIVNSPYFQLTETFGKTVLSGGLRYMNLGAPKMDYYQTAGLPNVPYDQIWAYNPVIDANAAVNEKSYGEFLPNFGIRHEFSHEWSASVSYGRKFGRPDWGPQAANFLNNEAAFVAQGVTLQSLVDRVKPELSDQIDLSANYNDGALNVTAILFGAKNQNRQVMVTDPSLGGLSYYQGTAKTTQYGIELEAEYQLDDSWLFFGSGTVASETFDDDTPTLAGGRALATGGKQIPNTANTLFKGGFSYRWRDLALSPIVRNVGPRYGDAAQVQHVSGYTVFDLNANYHLGYGIRLSMDLQNVFNRRYVAEIVPNDTNLNGAASYYAGAPRTLAFTLSGTF
jgi:iron complex outermembrane receptor protein